MSADLDLEFDVRVAAAIGQQIGASVQGVLDRNRGVVPVPVDVAFPDKADMPLGTGQPDYGKALGPLVGWAWQVTRIQITGAIAGNYTVYTSIGGAQAAAPQEQVPMPGGTQPNVFWEPRGLFLRMGEKLSAVGAAVTTAGIMRVEFINIREDWLGAYIM